MTNILAFAREAGGAQAIAPVCRAMKEKGWDVLLLAKDNGCHVFESRDLDYREFPGSDFPKLDGIVHERWASGPDLIFTSATSLPDLDMTEKRLWRWARENGIPAVGVLDQWQNYALRFSGPGNTEPLGYLPDRIFVMDELARREMVAEGIPEGRIVVTGQPSFDGLAEELKRASSERDKIRSRLNIKDDCATITFAAEALKKDFKENLGYDEQLTLRFLGDTLDEFSRRNKEKKLHLIIKLHPENRPDEFDWALNAWKHFTKSIIARELTAYQVIDVSDIVTGMTSIMLIESILMGKPTISLELNSTSGPGLAAAKAGAIPFINSPKEAKEVLDLLLRDPSYKEGYLKRQGSWDIARGATRRCLDVLEKMVSGHKR